jgi:hypothetical protein
MAKQTRKSKSDKAESESAESEATSIEKRGEELKDEMDSLMRSMTYWKRTRLSL